MRFEDWLRGQKAVGTDLALLKDGSIKSVLDLSLDGATIPFIARYRKERTGNLDEVAIQQIIEGKERWDDVLKRQLFLVSEIEKQGKLTDPLREKITTTYDIDLLEDIYLPYKLKRKTKATVAREAGLEPLAELIWKTAHGEAVDDGPTTDEALAALAQKYVDAEKKLPDVTAVLNGALDILTERLAEMVDLREVARKALKEKGYLRSKKTDKAKTPSKYENYFDYSEAVKNLMLNKNSHRYLALRRGWMEEELTIAIGGAKGFESSIEDELLAAFERAAVTHREGPASALALKAARQALKVYVLPAIDSETHKHLKEAADAAAITVFSENVRNLLMASPFGPKAVLGVDPGVRTGCKLALVNPAGQFIASSVIRFHTESERKEATAMIEACLREAQLQAIAVGNGTAGRETESFVRQVLKNTGNGQIPVVMVNEAGASVYSASEAAREEFPELDITVRGAISIARRLQDPLAELVKIDPKSIGVGQYQHDVNPSVLKKSLDLVVDSCVNRVGVNLNTASTHLLARVSGLGPGLARAVVEYRVSKGVFKSRAELLEVPRFTKKAFEQAAGFLRIPNSENPLDNTGIHPERYTLLETFAQKIGRTVKDIVGPGGVDVIKKDSAFKAEVGEFSFDDIVTELEKPGRDPRDSFVSFSFREDIHELKDLKGGMMCPGIVTNVTNFGAFVDIGVHQDGLVHISQLADRFVQDPNEIVKPGDRVTVKVLEINPEKRQISLTMRTGEAPAQMAPRNDYRPNNDGPRGGGGGGNGPRGHRDNRPDSGRNRGGFDPSVLGDLKDAKPAGPRPDPRRGFRGAGAGAKSGGAPAGGGGPSRPDDRSATGRPAQPARSHPPAPSSSRDNRTPNAGFRNNIFGQLDSFRDTFGSSGKPADKTKKE